MLSNSVKQKDAKIFDLEKKIKEIHREYQVYFFKTFTN